MYDVLITGATGFIGGKLIQNLKNSKILLISRKKIKIKNKLIKVLIYKNFSDLIFKLKKIKAKHIIHCATHYKKNHEINDIQKIFEANILLGNILLECSKKMNVRKFINLSTVWELNYNNLNDNLNLYTLSKKIFSKIIDFYSIKNKKLKIYTIYLLDTFGEGDKRNKILNEIKKKLNNDKKIIIESENLTMNFLNIYYVISAIKIVKNKNNLRKKEYIVCNSKNFKIKKLLKNIIF